MGNAIRSLRQESSGPIRNQRTRNRRNPYEPTVNPLGNDLGNPSRNERNLPRNPSRNERNPPRNNLGIDDELHNSDLFYGPEDPDILSGERLIVFVSIVVEAPRHRTRSVSRGRNDSQVSVNFGFGIPRTQGPTHSQVVMNAIMARLLFESPLPTLTPNMNLPSPTLNHVMRRFFTMAPSNPPGPSPENPIRPTAGNPLSPENPAAENPLLPENPVNSTADNPVNPPSSDENDTAENSAHSAAEPRTNLQNPVNTRPEEGVEIIAEYERFLREAMLGTPSLANSIDLNAQIPEVTFSCGQFLAKDPIKIDMFPIGGTEEKCTICLAPYDDGDTLRITSCLHAFHKSCLDQWLVSYNNSCPLCRKESVSNVGIAPLRGSDEPSLYHSTENSFTIVVSVPMFS